MKTQYVLSHPRAPLSPADLPLGRQGILPFATAPDGLHLAVNTRISPDNGARISLVDYHPEHLRKRHRFGVHTLTIPHKGNIEAYVTPTPLWHMLDVPLFAHIAASLQTGLSGITRYIPRTGAPDIPPRTSSSGHPITQRSDSSPSHFARRLAIDIATGHPYVVTMRANADDPPFTDEPPYSFIPESYRGLPGTRLVGNETLEIPLSPDDDINKCAIARAVERLPEVTWLVKIKRQAIAHVILQLAAKLHEDHQRGFVHGDLWPANVLITVNGAEPIDKTPTPIGTPATAMTMPWASPEQILREPLDPRSNLYTLGLFLTALVHGSAYGEVGNFIVPGGQPHAPISVLKVKGVYVPIDGTPYAAQWRTAWRALLDRCVNFAPEKRYPDIPAFLADAHEILRQHPLQGSVTFPHRIAPHLAKLADGSFAHVVDA